MPAPPRPRASTPVVKKPYVPVIKPGGNKLGRATTAPQAAAAKTAAAKAAAARAPATRLVGVRGPRLPTGTSLATYQNQIAKQLAKQVARKISPQGGGAMGPSGYTPYVDQYGRRIEPQRLTATDLGLAALGTSVPGGRGYYIPWTHKGLRGSLDTSTGNFIVNGRVIDLLDGGDGDGGDGGGGGDGGYPPGPEYTGIPGLNLMLWRI